MTESQSKVDLVNLFEQAFQGVVAQRKQINALDGFNGNHGDNMVENMRMVTETVRAHRTKSPSEALRSAGKQLGQAGKGGTSQFYSKGLLQAAEKLEGQTELTRADGVTFLETLLGAIPSQGFPEQGQTSSSILDMVMGLAGSQGQPEPEPQPPDQLGGLMDMVTGLTGGQQPQTQPQSDNPLGGLLDMVTGLTGGQQPAAEPQTQPDNQLGGLLDMVAGLTGAQQPQTESENEGFDLGNLFGKLLPAGLAYMQAQQSGADLTVAKMAFIRSLLGARPQQAETPRQAAGTVIAQSILQALMAR